MAANRQKTGAARQQQEEQKPLRERLQWLFRSLSLLSLIVVAMGLLWGADQVYSELDVPIGVIAVKGEFGHVERAEVQQLVEPLVEGGIISLDLTQIRSELELHPWIAEAVVSRQWPAGLLITVTEERPIARWGEAGFLNSGGEMLSIGSNRDLAHLPLLQGEQHTERSLMKAYREMTQLLQTSNLKISELRRDARGAWWVNLANGLELVIGRDQVMDKIRRFLEVWGADLKGKVEQVNHVDLRYDNGIAVQWIEQVVPGKVVPKKVGFKRNKTIGTGKTEQLCVMRNLITMPGVSGQV